MRYKLISTLAATLLLLLALVACDLNPTPIPTVATPTLLAAIPRSPSLDTSTPAAVSTITPTAVFIHGNGEFAYTVNDGSLHLHDLNGTDVTISDQLYSTPIADMGVATYASIPAFSPDGKYIAWLDGEDDLYIALVDQALRHDLHAIVYASRNVTGGFAWSADSLHLAFQTKSQVAPAIGETTPVVAPTFSQAAVNIISLSQTGETTTFPDLNGNFVWSHDGKYLAYARSGAIQLIETTDVTFPARSAGIIKLPNLAHIALLNWSPDGRYITLKAATQNGATLDLYLLDTQTQLPPRALLPGSYQPQWSFDSKLLCVRNDSSGTNDFVYDLECYQPNVRPTMTALYSFGIMRGGSWTIAPFIYDGPEGKGYLVDGVLLDLDKGTQGGLWGPPDAVLGWSPTQSNQHLAAVMNAGSDPASRILQVISIPVGRVTNLYTAHGSTTTFYPDRPNMEVLWSPDGKYLAFYAGGLSNVGNSPSPQNGVGIVDLNGKFTDSSLPDGEPLGWLEAGSNEIALFSGPPYAGQSLGMPVIYGLQPGGGKAVKLADGVFIAMRPGK